MSISAYLTIKSALTSIEDFTCKVDSTARSSQEWDIISKIRKIIAPLFKQLTPKAQQEIASLNARCTLCDETERKYHSYLWNYQHGRNQFGEKQSTQFRVSYDNRIQEATGYIIQAKKDRQAYKARIIEIKSDINNYRQ